MTDANLLPYYPRFILNCSDGKCLSTGDLDIFKFITESSSDYNISRFYPGQRINIAWENGAGEKEIKSYELKSIEVQEIKYDLDAPSYGLNSNDCMGLHGIEKKWMMEIYIFLDAVG
jgi:hypothetical protein